MTVFTEANTVEQMILDAVWASSGKIYIQCNMCMGVYHE